MTGAWKTSGAGVPSNNGLFIGSAPQKVLPMFATLNVLSGKVILTMGDNVTTGTNIEDIVFQVSCFASQSQGLGRLMLLADYADALYHRTSLTMQSGTNLCGIYRVSRTAAWWQDVEKLWAIHSTYRIMAG
jgi:hypothetical protein